MAIVIGMMAVTGCRATVNCCYPSAVFPRPCVSDSLEPMGSTELIPTVELPVELDGLLTSLDPPDNFFRIDAGTVQCTAAAQSRSASLILHEIGLVEERISRSHGRHLDPLLLQRDLLWHRSEEKRNGDAAAALLAYYQLADIEAQAQILDRSLSELRLMEERGRELKALQSDLEIDVTKLESQRNSLELDMVRLKQQRLRLNGQLQKLLGCPLDRQRLLWPDVPLLVTTTPVELELETAVALETHPNLRALRQVHFELKSSTLPVARAVLQVAEGSLGSSPRVRPLTYLLMVSPNGEELTVRNQQLAELVYQTEQSVIAEVADAVLEVETSQRRVALASANVQRWKDRVLQLERERQIDRVNSFTVSEARLELLKAESGLVQQVVSFFQADVRLKESQGMLAASCVFGCDADPALVPELEPPVLQPLPVVEPEIEEEL